jgi:YfiH family protein
MMAQPVITVPSFATKENGIEHFFGTRLSQVSVTPGLVTWRSGAIWGLRGPTALLSVNQVHGTDVLIVDRPVQEGASLEGAWDALITDQPGVAVTVRTADCVPVLVHDPVQRAVAAIHAGWRGAVAGIVPETLATLERHFHSKMSSLRMAIGPSAGFCCYEVDEPVLSKLRAAFPDWRLVVNDERGADTGLLDLRDLIRRQAIASGVKENSIAVVNACTICHSDLFYSYRREGAVKQTMVSGIALVPPR